MNFLITVVDLWALYGFAVLNLGPRWKFVRYLPMVIGGLIATAPFWSLMSLLFVPSGCRIDESGPNPCLLLGVDIGDLLYYIGNMAIWGFFILPILATVGAVYVALHLPFFIAAQRRDKAARPPEPKPRQVAVAATIVIAITVVQVWQEAKPSASELAARERNANWRMVVGTIPPGCPLSVKRAENFNDQDPRLKLMPEDALVAALAAGKAKCNTTIEQTISRDASSYYISTPGAATEIVVNARSGKISSAKPSGYLLPESR